MLSLLLIFFVNLVCAQTFTIGSLRYDVLSDGSVSVYSDFGLSGAVTIPASVTHEGKTYTVTYVRRILGTTITSVSLPETITRIGSLAFWNCSSLERLDIPQNVESIGGGILSGDCNKVMEITVANENNHFKVRDGMLISADGETMYAYAYGRAEQYLTIPSTVKNLESSLFEGNIYLKNVDISPNVTKLPSRLFQDCAALEKVNIHDQIKEFGTFVFSGCESLKQVCFPVGLKKIYPSNFEGCRAIESISVRQAVPLAIEPDYFPDEVYENAILYIPKGRKASFDSEPGWGRFRNITEIPMEGVEISDSPYDNILPNQMIFGYYRTNDLRKSSGYGGPRAGTYRCCTSYTDVQMAPFAGNKITNIRFGLINTDIQNVKVWVGTTRDKEDLAVQEVNTLKVGWNEVVLATPVQLTGDGISIGISYQQSSSNYPISWNNLGSEPGSCYLYAPYGDDGENRWASINSSASIQAIIEGSNLPQYDLHAQNFFLWEKYSKAGKTMKGFYNMRNWGKRDIRDFDLTFYIDGKELNTQTVNMLNYYFFVDLDEHLKSGKHDFKLMVTAINGERPLFNADDSLNMTINVYHDSMERQKVLLDFFTAQWCPNSLSRVQEIEKLMSERSDIALVSSHNVDDMSCKAGENYLAVFTNALPYICYNRYALGNTTDFVALGPNDAKALPSFADVNIASTYSPDTRTLNIKVTGTKNEDFDAVEEYTNLTVLLTEDNIVLPQQNGNEVIEDYFHQGVLRTNVSKTWGDPVVWNGNCYEMDYTVVLDENWNHENINIVAFLAKPFNGYNYDEIDVLNCNSQKISNDLSGIKQLAKDNNETSSIPMKFYDMQGRSMSSLFHGLGVIRKDNGMVKKVIIK